MSENGIFDDIHTEYKHFRPVAAELFSAAWCNLDCRYCYIPKKDKDIIERHKNIIEEVKAVDPIINRLKKIYGENLTALSHWGSEPTLTIKYFHDFYKRALQEFPNLDKIKLSSNFCTNVENLSNFIFDLPEDRKLDIEIQVSLDGPPWITDYNRRQGKTKVILSNLYKVINILNSKKDLYHNITMHFKPTWSIDNMKYILNHDLAEDYFAFFDDVVFNMYKNNYNRNIGIAANSCNPTVVCLNNYNKEDGEIFYNVYHKIQEIPKKFKYVKADISYYSNFKKFFDSMVDEYWTKQKMFTCSAGDSQFGVSDDNLLHLCHHTFYLKYQDLMVDDDDRLGSNIDKDNVLTGRADRIFRNLPDIDDKKGITDYYYVSRAFHDFTKHKVNLGTCMVRELADCGQVSEVYKDWDMATILATFCINRHDCFLDTLLNFGSLSVYNYSYFKFFGNGIIEDFVRRYKNERR